jgi:hypothetical protein
VKKLLVIILSAALFSPVFAAKYDGYYSAGYEQYERFGETYSFITNSIKFGAEKLWTDGLSLYVQGDYITALKNERSHGELFLGYLNYKSFQGATDISLGRFAHITNRFLSLDGVSVSQITPWYFGVSGFIGAPNYLDGTDYVDAFRHTGDLSYGGKIFLNGVKRIKFNLNYYRETGKDETDSFAVYKETAGFGAAVFSGEGGNFRSFDAALDQDIYHGNLARASARFSIVHGGFKGAVFGDYFDVRDDYPFDRELIIRFISSGEESRGGFTADYKIASRVDVYAGFTYTNVVLRSGDDAVGQIYRAGSEISLVKEAGLSANLEVYDYESEIMRAFGFAAGFQWQFSEDFVLSGTIEKAYLRESIHDNDASSGEIRLLTYLTEDFSLLLYAQIGSDNRFVDKTRWGGELKYAF